MRVKETGELSTGHLSVCLLLHNFRSRHQIPMVNYLSAIGRKQAPPLSPFYAQLESDRHPAWPTHILWSQLMAEVILLSLQQAGEKNTSSPASYSHPSPIFSSSLIQYGLCLQVLLLLILAVS